MKAIVLAAGHGERMRPLTNSLPKPMLRVQGKPLLQYHVEALARAGVRDIVINHARLGHLIEAYFGDGAAHGVSIRYSAEGDEPLETGGGMKRALPLLGQAPFLAVNADIWTDFPLHSLIGVCPETVHLVLVPNPPHHPGGDFALQHGILHNGPADTRTFAGIGVYHPGIFDKIQDEAFPLAPLLKHVIASQRVTGQLYEGEWFDIGTPERLANLENHLLLKKASTD